MRNDKTTTISLKDLQEGDWIQDENGNPVLVKKVYEDHLPEKMYQIEMQDGSTVKASGNHLWYIETEEDVVNHYDRLKNAKEFLSRMPSVLHQGLVALANEEEEYEITLLELVELFDYEKPNNPLHIYSEEAYFLINRILISVGHIVEYTQTYQDLSTGEMIDDPMEKIYDCRVVAQQILSLTGEKRYQKQWPVLIGRVVTTNDLFERYPDANIPLAKKSYNFFKK